MNTLYLCALIFTLINFFISKKIYKFYLIAILVVIVYFSFNLHLIPSMDLYRRIGEMDLYKNMGLQWVLENRIEDNPLGVLMFYAFSLLDDYRWIPAITSFVCYGIAFYLLLKCVDRYDLSKQTMNCLLMFFCFCFYYDHAITNIRIYVCYAFVAFFMYKEIIEQKFRKISWIVYILCCYVHYAALPLVLLRICLLVYKWKKKWLVALIIIISLLSMSISFLPFIFSGAGGVIGTAIQKISGYEDYSTFGLFQFVSSLIRIIPIASICLYIIKFGDSSIEREKEICFYILLLCVMLVCMSNQYQFIYRTPNFLHYLGMIPVSIISKKNIYMYRLNKSYLFLAMQLLLIVAVIFTIAYQVILIYPYLSFDI